jgi:hypothetical protein
MHRCCYSPPPPPPSPSSSLQAAAHLIFTCETLRNPEVIVHRADEKLVGSRHH